MRTIYRDSPADYHISTKIKKFRTEMGMSQEQLAEMIGVSFQQVQKYEAARNRLSASKLYEVAQALNKPINAFFDGLDPKGRYYNYKLKSEKKLQLESESLNKDLLPLIRAFNMIDNKKVRQHLVALAQEIAGPFYRKKVKHKYS